MEPGWCCPASLDSRSPSVARRRRPPTRAVSRPTTTDPITTDPTTGDTTTGDTTTGGPDPFCGDGNEDAGEECDSGADNADDKACTVECKINICGDGS